MQRDAPSGAKLHRLRAGLFTVDMTVRQQTAFGQLFLRARKDARSLSHPVPCG